MARTLEEAISGLEDLIAELRAERYREELETQWHEIRRLLLEEQPDWAQVWRAFEELRTLRLNQLEEKSDGA